MSQEPPNSQPPLSPEPGAEQSETTVERETQNRQKPSKRVQTVFKAQSIKAVRGTIQVLEGVLEKLEAEPPAGTLPPGATRETPSFLDKLQIGWGAATAKIRSFLPENLNQKLSDTALTGIIAGITVLLFWTTSALLPGKPPEIAINPAAEEKPPEVAINPAAEEKPPEVATNPVAEEVPPANITTPPELTAPAAPQPIEVTPLPESVPEPTPMEPTPTPMELTPEQNLIASIENRVAEITDSYADGLIKSIQPNFQGSRLIVTVGDDWYNLEQSRQNKLAARMLERAREFDFSQLEITDSEGTVLARSPVVGKDMVILKRHVFMG